MSSPKRALMICAHDDDEVIGCGGTIRKLCSEGTEVTTLIFAVGNEGYSRADQKEIIIEQRKKERAAAGEILGTKQYLTYDYQDFENLDCENVYRVIMAAVREVRPELVLTHYPAEYIGHRTLGTIAPEAVMQASWPCSPDLGEPWQVTTILQFAVLELLSEPTHILDISETFDAKMDAMKAYASQTQVVEGILQSMEGRARCYGAHTGVAYAEAFILNPKIPQCKI
jgi:LmbE family N-acetylglucosaminyl deacetylase